MDNEKLKKQMRDLCIAADSMATAMHLFYANVSSDILDDIIAQAERENRQQEENFDKWRDMKRTVETLCGPVLLLNLDDHHHCGQDASCPVGGGCATVQDPNESQPADTHVSLNDLLGMEVISVGDMPCDACNPDNYDGRPCVKVELVGGTYLCLAPRPNSIITE